MKMKLLSYVVVQITTGYRNKWDKVELLTTDFIVVNLIDMLLNDGFIGSYKITSNSVIVYLRYNNGSPVLRGMKTIGSNVKQVSYSIDTVNTMDNVFGVTYINTSYGLVNNNIASKMGVGGIAMIHVW